MTWPTLAEAIAAACMSSDAEQVAWAQRVLARLAALLDAGEPFAIADVLAVEADAPLPEAIYFDCAAELPQP